MIESHHRPRATGMGFLALLQNSINLVPMWLKFVVSAQILANGNVTQTRLDWLVSNYSALYPKFGSITCLRPEFTSQTPSNYLVPKQRFCSKAPWALPFLHYWRAGIHYKSCLAQESCWVMKSSEKHYSHPISSVIRYVSF